MSNTIVIFGASGDLTSRKLIPALYQLFRKKRLPKGTRIVGMARSVRTDDGWREELAASTAQSSDGVFDADSWREFAASVYYLPGDIERQEDFARLGERLTEIEGGEATSRLYYLSTLPRLYATVAARLGAAGLADESVGPRRIVIEKPFGSNLRSARELNDSLHKVFTERQIFRIDHYLG
ncbi:MAG TPA: glucose-6-phosphate dehydrogenase, partial [Pirellulaceae bacterium]|nr:glucose-6-phosphate dehydrogenase [Pirellulaceae bacterium]